MQHFTKSQIIILSVIGFVLIITLGIFTGVLPGLRKTTQKPPDVSLIIWGVDDQNNGLSQGIQAYQALNSNVRATYEQVDLEQYEARLINALAAGKGPDIFMIHNTWIPKHYDKITPVGDTQITLSEFQNFYPIVVQQDFAPDNLIYALPLYIDTLALYYNQDVFDSAGVAIPPKSWNEFQEIVTKVRKIDKSENILVAGAAFGGSSKSISVAPDLISLLMLQNGTQMTNNDFTAATFSSNANNAPGLAAFSFYTKFSNPQSIYYTWNDAMSDTQNFLNNKVGMIFGYSNLKKQLRDASPILNIKAIPVPQINPVGAKIDFADYWGLAVSNRSQNSDWAWKLVKYLCADETAAQAYLENSQRPPALKSLIAKYSDDQEFGIFAKQALYARSWPQIDNKAVSIIFSQMIEAVLQKTMTDSAALDAGENAISNLMTARQ